MKMTKHGEVATRDERSHGHIGFTTSGFEYFWIGEEVYLAPISAPLADISGPGPRRHGRWECGKLHFEHYRLNVYVDVLTEEDEAIVALRAEAVAAGDEAQVALCNRALAPVAIHRVCAHHRAYPEAWACQGEPTSYCKDTNLDRQRARQECARVIATARAA